MPGSIPSARNATFTPAPVKPSDRAVTAPAVAETVWVRVSASGASCGVAEQAPAGALTVDAAVSGMAAVGTSAAGGSAAAAGPTIGLSGITAATPGLSASVATAELGIRAAMASTSAYLCTSAAPSCSSWLR